MGSRERDIYTELVRFYCPEVDINDFGTSSVFSSSKSLRLTVSSEHSLLALQPQNHTAVSYQFANQTPIQVHTDLSLKRIREFTMVEPIVALERVSSNRFLVGTASHSVVEFDTNLQKASTFHQLHSNRISVLHSFYAQGTQRANHPTHFLSGSDDHLIKLNSYERAMTVQTFVGSATGITSISYEPQNDIVISANRSGQVHMWSQKAQRPLCLYSCENAGSTFPTTLARFTPNPSYFVAASGTFLSLWDLRYNGRPVISANILPSCAESLVLLNTTADAASYLETRTSIYSTSCEWAVLTGKGLFRIALDDNLRAVQYATDLSISTICNVLACNLFLKQSESPKTTPCLLVINRGQPEEYADANENTLPLSVVSQKDYRQRLDYICKRPHKIGRNAQVTYLEPHALELEDQGLVLVSSDSITLHLYRIGIRAGQSGNQKSQQSKNKKLE
ncbi:Hypothetical protein GLP15_2908 [Giardia lamblia P15]|uniref:Uncharacterized protein n=1 Tax=Giardia intestinalis (strain P15) TaxID=658858 RepID=E1EZL5_GIAIA|nr:Hypothetical protein GLP15_2908 [Giardia lamblia P15]